MRKPLLFIISLFIILFMTTCDIGLGTNNQAPDNPFADGEWEHEYTSGDVRQYKKISFSNNQFTFYEKNEGVWNPNENTYTGTYSLLIGERQLKIINCVSASPKANGRTTYTFSFDGTNYTNGEKVLFINWLGTAEGNQFLDETGVFNRID